MSTLPKISIVTPSFNQGHFIEQTINSVLDQDYPNLEYIVIDGGSTDDTVEILRRYSNHLKLWVSEKDRGQSHAINKGLKHCTGQVFNWLNSDDFLQPEALQTIGEEYQKEPFTALCCKTNVLDNVSFSHVRKPSFIGKTKEDTIANFNINQEGTWLALDAVKMAGGVNEDFHYCMDLDLWFRVLLKNPFNSFRSSDSIVSNFRRHPDAKSTVETKNKIGASGFLTEELQLFNKMLPDGANWDYFDILDVKPLNSIGENVLFNVNNEIRETITEKYLFHLLSKYYDIGNYDKAKNISAKLKLSSNNVNWRSLLYLKRKLWFTR